MEKLEVFFQNQTIPENDNEFMELAEEDLEIFGQLDFLVQQGPQIAILASTFCLFVCFSFLQNFFSQERLLLQLFFNIKVSKLGHIFIASGLAGHNVSYPSDS